jgi:hypothetical protein
MYVVGEQTKPAAVPEHQLDPIGAFRPLRTDPTPSALAPAPPNPQRFCGSRPAWSLPSRGPRRSGRSRCGFQRTKHHDYRACRSVSSDAHDDAVDLQLDGQLEGCRSALRLPDLVINNCRCKQGLGVFGRASALSAWTR